MQGVPTPPSGTGWGGGGTNGSVRVSLVCSYGLADLIILGAVKARGGEIQSHTEALLALTSGQEP